jgi:hypothetical protein
MEESKYCKLERKEFKNKISDSKTGRINCAWRLKRFKKDLNRV